MPAVASRYWRIGFRSATTTGSCHLPLSTLKVLNSSLVDQTGSATVTVQNLLAGSSAANLSDNSNATTGTMTFTAGTTFQYVTYDFGSGNTASLSSFLIRVSSASTTGTSKITASALDMLVQSSSDNTTWLTQTVLGRPLAADDVDYYMAMIPDSLYYPVPSRTQIAGNGGIYGIVSEDGVALPNRPVILYDRDDFSKIGYATTDVNGGYAFNGLNENREYLVMSVDPSGPPYKNALVYDRITPINTKTQLQTQSPFWAQRLRDPKFGFSFAITKFIDGVTNNEFEISPGGVSYQRDLSPIMFDGLTVSPTEGALGSFQFIKSNRVSNSTRGQGLFAVGAGFFGDGAVSNPDEYGALSFELICIPPTPSETSLIAFWMMTPDSNDSATSCVISGFDRLRTGPTIEVTPTAVNVRMGLGGNNFSTVRATAPVVQNQIHHIVFTYVQDSEIKLYVNGALAATTAIAGSGRPFTAPWAVDTGAVQDFGGTWNVDTAVVARRVGGIAVCGAGLFGTAKYPPGWGGYFGAANFWGRALSQSDVTKLSDSVTDTANFVPLTTLSGYAAEVEVDNPSYYFRLNETSQPASFVRPISGRKALNLTYRAGTAFGVNAGFVAGSTAVDFSNSAGAYLTASQFSNTFSVEMWVRPTSLSALGYLFAVGAYQPALNPAQMTLSTGGILSLLLYDKTGITTTITFSHTPLAVNTSYHLVVTYDPWVEKTAKLYLNGVLADTKNAPAIPVAHTSLFTGIGCRANNNIQWGSTSTIDAPTFGTDHFRGVMGEFAWYNHRLTAARVQAHYDARNY